MKLGFIILAHNQPDAVRRLVDVLAGAGHRVVVHFDTGAAAAERQAITALENTHGGRVSVISKVHCVWGEWSLVEAVLLGLREFAAMPDKPDHIHLMSGADFPIRPLADFEEFLRRNAGMDFIECCDITQRRWVKGGLSMERFRFFFPVNFRTRRKTFDRLVRWHRKLHIRRVIPLGMTPHMGSQWWTLRWSTCEAVLSFLRKHPRVVRYFRLTWIPDEAFFQTVIAHLVPRREIADLQLMLHHLTPTGRPYVVYQDHLPWVRKLPHFFIRKVSPAILDRLWAMASARKSPLPRPVHLARVRDRVRDAIDRNHQHSSRVPGHPFGAPPTHSGGPAAVFLTENVSETDLVRSHAEAHPGAFWGGRPFAPRSIELGDGLLSRTGLTPEMTRVRENFPEAFADTLAAALPDDRVSVLVIQSGDNALTAAMPPRLRAAGFFSFHARPHDPVLASVDVAEIPQRHIPRVLDKLAPQGPATAAKSWLEVHEFGRIGNFFHLHATIRTADMRDMRFILPGVAQAVRPESSQVRAAADGSARVLLWFWVDDGAYLEIGRRHPAHVLCASSSVAPQTIHVLRESNGSDILHMLQSFGDSSAWSDRLLLESLALCSIPERCEFIRHASAHWSTESTAACMAVVMAGDTPIFADPEHAAPTVPAPDPEWEQTIGALAVESARDGAAACRLAWHAIRTPGLPRREILRAVHTCLPRDSKWWLLALAAKPSLGNEQVADALNSIGCSAVLQGRADLAELCFTATTLIHPASQSPAWNLGLLLASLGRIGDARRAFHTIRRHYAKESISTLWPSVRLNPWPTHPWPADAHTLPEGVAGWPRISVITPSYQQGAYIEETILSVLHQNYPNLQYIVVDGNSSDGTRAILEFYRSRIDHLIIEPDEGQTQAINKGLRLADGELVAWLNSDDMYAPGALHEAALEWLATGADVLAGICAEHRDRSFNVINKPSATNRDFNTAQLARIFPHWFSGMYFFQPEVFFTKALLDRVGLLDESLHYAMDYDLWMRFAQADARLRVIDWPFAFFRLHDAQKTSRSASCIAEQCAVRNRHHPLALRDERGHQLARQCKALGTTKNPRIAVLSTSSIDESMMAGLARDSCPEATIAIASDPLDPVVGAADLALIPIGADRAELSLLEALRAAHPGLLLVGWFADCARNPHANHDASLRVDVVVPADARIGEYLRNDSSLMGPEMRSLTARDLINCLSRLVQPGTSGA